MTARRPLADLKHMATDNEAVQIFRNPHSGAAGVTFHQGSDRPARYSTKAILAAVRALADACIDHATDLNF